MKSLLLSCVVLILSLNFISCVDKINTGENPPAYTDSYNSFDFATAKSIVVDVTYPLQFRSKVEIYTQNPISLDELKDYVKDATLEPIAAGYTDENGKLRVTLRVADMSDEIFVYTPSNGLPVVLGGKLNSSNEIILTQDDSIEPTTKSQTRGHGNVKEYWENWDQQKFNFKTNPEWSYKQANGKPEYLLSNRFTITDNLMDIINATIPKKGNINPNYIALNDISILENTNIKIHFISSSSSRKNSLAYYTYTDEKPTKEQINTTSTIVFPNLSKEALKAGDGVELQYFDGEKWSNTFPKGVKIGFVLLFDAWHGNNMSTDVLAMYSEKEYNNYNIPSLSQEITSQPHMATFRADNKFILSFEDLPWHQNSAYPGDFADDIFVLEANSDTALPPLDNGIGTEDPGYGIEMKTKGIMAFEDLWPNKGDYDMNDIVVKYSSTYILSPDYTYVTSFNDEYTLIYVGAQFRNGFGIEFDFTTSDIANFDLSATNGVNPPQFDNHALINNATLALFDDANNIPKGTLYKVNVEFKGAGYPASKFKASPHNPFITINAISGNETRREVHFVNHKPTPRVDISQFGKGDDKSNPLEDIYYVSDAEYPFAIDIVGEDTYVVPRENQAISDVYPDFSSWVKSKGTQDKDWYKKK